MNDALYTIHLECGHYWAGLTREMLDGDTFPCGQCTVIILDDEYEKPEPVQIDDIGDSIQQLSMFAEEQT